MKEQKIDRFKKYLKIDNSNINDEMSKLPMLIYNYGLKSKIVKDKLEDLELELEVKESTIAAQSRVKYKNAKNLLSETHIKDLVKSNPQLIEIKEEIKDLNKTYRLVKLKISSLKVKSEMLVNIGHNIREEKKANSLRKVK